MSTVAGEQVALNLEESRITGYVVELQAASYARAAALDAWGAVITQLTADSLVAATAAARTGTKVGSGVHSATVDPEMSAGSAATLVSAQRMLISTQLTDAAASVFWSLLPLVAHLEGLPCPDVQDADDSTAELMLGVELPERQSFLRVKAGKLAVVANLLKEMGRDQDFVRATYRCDLLVFELAAIEAAAAVGDQHLSTATVKMLLARAALSGAASNHVFLDASSAIDTERQILSWAMMGATEPLPWLT